MVKSSDGERGRDGKEARDVAAVAAARHPVYAFCWRTARQRSKEKGTVMHHLARQQAVASTGRQRASCRPDHPGPIPGHLSMASAEVGTSVRPAASAKASRRRVRCAVVRGCRRRGRRGSADPAVGYLHGTMPWLPPCCLCLCQHGTPMERAVCVQLQSHYLAGASAGIPPTTTSPIIPHVAFTYARMAKPLKYVVRAIAVALLSKRLRRHPQLNPPKC